MRKTKIKSRKDSMLEKQLKQLIKLIAGGGYEVRREKLVRGHSFKVKSGNCLYAGQKLIFLDKRLPLSKQFDVLIDYLIELKIKLKSEEMIELPEKSRVLLEQNNLIAA